MRRHGRDAQIDASLLRRACLLRASLLLGLAAAGCGSRSAQQGGDAGPPVDARRADHAARDAAVPADLAAPADLPCTCPPGKVFTVGPCVPTRELGECVTPCTVTEPKSCPPLELCDQWAASTSCFSAQALPACVPGPAMGFPPGTLRSEPQSGNAGGPALLSIEGGDFYIGALIWYARIAGGPEVLLEGGGACRARVVLKPPGPGLHAVEVSYGNAGGGHDWSLAGFYLASGGIPPAPAAQPGERCSSTLPCATAPPYSCSCAQGRCQCQPRP